MAAPCARAERLFVAATPWGLPFAPEALVTVLEARLPGWSVTVGTTSKELADAGERAFTLRAVARPMGAPELVLMQAGSADVLWRATPQELADVGDPVHSAAVFVAMALEEALHDQRPPAVASAPPAPDAPLPASDPLFEMLAAPALTGYASGPIAYGVLVEALFFPGDGARFHVGTRIDSQIRGDFPGGTLGVSVRAVWLGAGYRLHFTDALHLDLGFAMEYAHPVFDLRGASDAAPADDALARWSVRPSATFGWQPLPHLALELGFAVAAGFGEHNLSVGSAEAVEMGAFAFDLYLGLGVVL